MSRSALVPQPMPPLLLLGEVVGVVMPCRRAVACVKVRNDHLSQLLLCLPRIDPLRSNSNLVHR